MTKQFYYAEYSYKKKCWVAKPINLSAINVNGHATYNTSAFVCCNACKDRVLQYCKSQDEEEFAGGYQSLNFN